jgi:hypothetical protein
MKEETQRWGNEETDKWMEMYRKSHMIPGSMFDDVVDEHVFRTSF